MRDDVRESVLREEGRVGKLSIEGFKPGNIEDCEGMVWDDDREAVLRDLRCMFKLA